MLQTQDKWKIMENRRLCGQIENYELWLEARAKQNANKIGLTIYQLIVLCKLSYLL